MTATSVEGMLRGLSQAAAVYDESLPIYGWLQS